LSEAAIAQADIAMRIPMVGFSESFNISVSAALCLYDLTTRLRQQTQDWGLSEEEKADIQLQWLRQSRRASQILEQKFRESR
jgi:tRNA (guanosine-2'-O-)-methyltransferase